MHRQRFLKMSRNTSLRLAGSALTFSLFFGLLKHVAATRKSRSACRSRPTRDHPPSGAFSRSPRRSAVPLIASRYFRQPRQQSHRSRG